MKIIKKDEGGRKDDAPSIFQGRRRIIDIKEANIHGCLEMPRISSDLIRLEATKRSKRLK